jgi:hypothetical protein
MTLFSRAARALLVLAAAAAPARALAQDAEAWVLPRGLLEVSSGGLFTSYDARLGFGGPALGAEFVDPLQGAAERLTGPATAVARTGLADFFAGTTDPDPTSRGGLPQSLTPGRVALRLTGDERTVPFNVRYGLTRRLTLSLLVPFERRGTSVVGPYLAGGTLGLNPNRTGNAAVLDSVDARFAGFGGGLLLPVRGTPEAVELQERLRATPEGDTLTLPIAPINVAQLLGDQASAALLTEGERAGLGLTSARRPYQLGDVQLGARFLLLRGPAGWPFPDSVTGRSLRTSVGARVRLPTGRSGARFFSEIFPGGGHLGVGVDVLNDVFLSSRWYVNASGSLDVFLPTDVQRLAFSAANPFPTDSAVQTVRRAPGPRLSINVTPRWRLTDELSFAGEYSLLAQRRVEYSGGEAGLLPSPLEWRTGGSMHALGIGARYSSLQAFARGRARVPFEITLSTSRAIAGGGQAPNATTVRLTARIFMDPRGFARFLPGDPPPADTAAAPAAPDSVPAPAVVPPQPDTAAGDSAARPVPSRPQAAAEARDPAQSHRSLASSRRHTAPERRRMAPAR